MTSKGNYLNRALQQRLPDVLEKRYRKLHFENGDLIPTTPDLEPGVAEVVHDVINEVGEAQILADGSWDIPLVEISASEDKYKVVMIASGMPFTYQQERAATYANSNGYRNRDPYTQKLKTARRAIAEKANYLAAYGDANVGLPGFFNNSSVPVQNSGFNPWTANGQELVEFFLDTLDAIVTGSNNIEYPTDILISSELDFRLIQTTLPNTSESAKEVILARLNAGNGEEDPDIMITPVQESRSSRLENAGIHLPQTERDRIVVYPMDEECVNRRIESEIAQIMPEEYTEIRNGRKIIPLFTTTTPTMINYPGGFRYVDVVKRPTLL